MSHGETKTIEIDCPIQFGSSPQETQIVNVRGPIGILGDPFANEIDVFDDAGDPVNPPLPGMVQPAGAPPDFTVVSNDVDGPPRVVGYVITMRLRDPGVRTQILKCQVFVRHTQPRCWLNSFGTPVGSGFLQVEVDAVPGPPLPDIHGVEVVFAEQNPVWQTLTPNSHPPGWMPQVLPDRVRYTLDPMLGPPITPGGGPFFFQFFFQTVGGTPPVSGEVHFFDGAPVPNEVAHEHIVQFMHTP
jgi:hypothetical protein